jgi:AcrR family transcriptional regulator
MTVGETDGRKAIGARNREAILAGALSVLQQDPNAGINEIADGAGVGRATLYRHFPTREELLAALRQRAREQGKAAMVAARPDEGDPIAALIRIVTALMELGAGNRVLFGDPKTRPKLADRERHFLPVTRIFERAQREGIIDPSLTSTWLTSALRMLLGAAVDEIKAGRLERKDAPELIVRQLIEGARKR